MFRNRLSQALSNPDSKSEDRPPNPPDAEAPGRGRLPGHGRDGQGHLAGHQPGEGPPHPSSAPGSLVDRPLRFSGPNVFWEIPYRPRSSTLPIQGI